MKCRTLVYKGLGVEQECGKPATAIFDKGKPGGHPVCSKHADMYHQERLTPVRFQHYDSAGRIYGLSDKEVGALVRKYGLPRRKIMGRMAVGSHAWDNLMLYLD